MSIFARLLASALVRYRAFQLVFAAAALNFILPAISYIVAPELAVQTMDDVNRLLGGPAWPSETGQVWHMLAVGNVMTLGVLCAVIGFDVLRHHRMLPALVFLKAFSAFYSFYLALSLDGVPAFFAVFALDGTTALLLWIFGVVGHRAALRLPARKQPLPWWAYALIRPRRVQAHLEIIAARQGQPAPTLWQMLLWTGHMWRRVLLDLDSVGSGGGASVRKTWRARWLRVKAIRALALIGERAIAPLDMSGLATDDDRVMRHLLAAHHDGMEFAYDLEMLSLRPGALARLRVQVEAIVDGRHPRGEWLRDLCVYEGYHERLLAGVDLALSGALPRSENPDTSFFAMLDWARSRAPSPRWPTTATPSPSASPT